MRELVTILGIPIDNLTLDSALQRIEEMVYFGRTHRRSHQIATVNTNFLTNARSDPMLNRLLNNVDMATADGMPLIWASRLLGTPLRERVTGSDMVPALAARAAEKGLSLYLLGAAPGVAQRAADLLQARHPQLIIAGVASPPFEPIETMDRAYIDAIKQADPDILLVAFGNPKQEKWIDRYGSEINVPVMIGVGASLDFIAGKTRRAPLWMQNLGLEWAYRVLQEPGRLWRRYVTNFLVFFPCVIWQLLTTWRQQRLAAVPARTSMTLVNNTIILSVQGSLNHHNYRGFIERAEQALQHTPFLLLNLANAGAIDATALDGLIQLARDARAAGGDLKLIAVPRHIRRSAAYQQIAGSIGSLAELEREDTTAHPAVPEPLSQASSLTLDDKARR